MSLPRTAALIIAPCLSTTLPLRIARWPCANKDCTAQQQSTRRDLSQAGKFRFWLVTIVPVTPVRGSALFSCDSRHSRPSCMMKYVVLVAIPFTASCAKFVYAAADRSAEKNPCAYLFAQANGECQDGSCTVKIEAGSEGELLGSRVTSFTTTLPTAFCGGVPIALTCGDR